MTFCSKKMWLSACPLSSLPATHPHPDSYKPFKTEADWFFVLTIRLQTCVVLPCSSWKQQDMEKPPEHSRSFSHKMPKWFVVLSLGTLFLNDNLPQQKLQGYFPSGLPGHSRSEATGRQLMQVKVLQVAPETQVPWRPHGSTKKTHSIINSFI